MTKSMEEWDRKRCEFEDEYGLMRESGVFLPEEERALCTPEEELDDEGREILRTLQTEVPIPDNGEVLE